MSFFLRGHTHQGQPTGQPWPDAWISNDRGSYAPSQFISGTSPFPTSISAGIRAPPWQWWTQPGTSPWGRNWAQRLADGRIMNSMNERMIQKHVEDSFLSPRHSDIRIMCGDTVFSTHKIIICHMSRYFKAAFHGKFRESCGCLTLTDKDPILVEKVFQYLYTGNYSVDPDKEETGEISSDDSENSSLDGKPAFRQWKRVPKKRKRFGVRKMIHLFTMGARPKKRAALDGRLFHSPAYFHLHMYAEADYFMIDELKVKAEAEFCQSFENLLTIELIFKKEYAAKFAISKIINELYNRRENYGVLREMVLELMLNNMPGLRQTIFMSPMEGCCFLSLHPEFGADLCWGMMEKAFPSDMPTYYPTLMPEQFAYWERQCNSMTGQL